APTTHLIARDHTITVTERDRNSRYKDSILIPNRTGEAVGWIFVSGCGAFQHLYQVVEPGWRRGGEACTKGTWNNIFQCVQKSVGIELQRIECLSGFAYCCSKFGGRDGVVFIQRFGPGFGDQGSRTVHIGAELSSAGRNNCA